MAVVDLRVMRVLMDQRVVPVDVHVRLPAIPRESVRVLVMCGRDEVDPSAPSFDQVYNQINEDKVNSRARRYLRDLRRDAVIEFR